MSLRTLVVIRQLSMRLESGIQQYRFSNDLIKTALNLHYTAASLNYLKCRVLRPFDLTLPQYNILKIVQGQEGKSIQLKEIAKRMVDPMSNASRLVDKLEYKGLLQRNPSDLDRRAVHIDITDQGTKLILKATQIFESTLSEILCVLSMEQIRQLNELLDIITESYDFRAGQ